MYPLQRKNSTVSLQAKGLSAYIEGKPDGWKFSLVGLLPKEGVTCIEPFEVLEQSGYLKREKKKNELTLVF